MEEKEKENEYEKKIFIVNDDKLLLEMYALKFKDEGFWVTQAFGSVDAIEKLRGGIVPDIILLDVTAPVMESIDLLGIIRNENLVPSADVIILSNDAKPIFDEKARALGVKGYVSKVSATPAQIVQGVVAILNTTDSSFK